MKQKKIFKNLTSLVVTAVMLISTLATGVVFAQDETTATVYLTVSNQGVLAQAADGSAMADRAVTVTDLNDDNILTVDEALVAAHTQYLNTDGYVATEGSYGMSVTKLWGVDTQNTLFFINNIGLSADVGTDTVANGDKLVASINKDNTYWADWYSFFDIGKKTVKANEQFTLTLKGHLGMAYPPEDVEDVGLSGVTIGTWESGSFISADMTTDENGEVTLSFSETGTYYITAQGTVNDTVSDWSQPPYDGSVTIQVDCPIISPVCVVTVDFCGDGTQSSPYELSSAADFQTLANRVSQGETFSGEYFVVTSDITMPEDWQGIGALKEGTSTEETGVNINPFSGFLNGNNKTLTFANGSMPLFKYVRSAKVENLNIYGEYIAEEGLVSDYTVDYGENGEYSSGCPAIDIHNVTIKSGTVIRGSGFIGGYASGINEVNIVNCTIEDGVKIGCNANGTSAQADKIGAFAGDFNGKIINCVSYADVYGKDYIGGIVGKKGQAMGTFEVRNCEFYGSVNASGNYVGGIAGGGYPISNGPCVTIENCLSAGSISGSDYIGGILGIDNISQCWENGRGYINSNLFVGNINCENGLYQGGIAGYIGALNRYTTILNNYYKSCENIENGFGAVGYVDTDYQEHETESDAVYYNTSVSLPDLNGVTKSNHNRSDDPLGADKEKLSKTALVAELSDGTTVNQLNNGDGSLNNWIQGDEYPVISDEAVAYSLDISGTYKDEYYIGEELQLSGISFSATWTDGTVTSPEIEDVTIIGYDSSTTGVRTLYAKYGAACTQFNVTVKKKSSSINSNKDNDPKDDFKPLEDTTTKQEEDTDKNNILTENAFNDINSDDWYYESVKYVYENGLMNGLGEGFEPEGNMTRAMLVTVLYRLAQPDDVNIDNPFEDIVDGQWYCDAVKWAAANGIVNGVSETRFAPDNNITREQIVTIIYRYMQFVKLDTKESADLSGYEDCSEISDWAKEAMSWANAIGLVSGTSKSTLSPSDNATRAEVSTIIMRLCENVL